MKGKVKFNFEERGDMPRFIWGSSGRSTAYAGVLGVESFGDADEKKFDLGVDWLGWLR